MTWHVLSTEILHIDGLQIWDVRTYKVKAPQIINTTRKFQVLDKTWVFDAHTLYHVAEVFSLLDMNGDILTCRTIMRQRVVLPIDDGIREKFQLVVARSSSLVDLEGELMQLASDIVHCLRTRERHCLAIDGYHEKRSACCHRLRQYHGTVFAFCLLRNDRCIVCTTRRSD